MLEHRPAPVIPPAITGRVVDPIGMDIFGTDDL